MRYGFEELKLREIVSFTVPANVPSRRVMEKIGMSFEMRTSYYNIEVVQYAITADEFNSG